jgi:hypothetical protein
MRALQQRDMFTRRWRDVVVPAKEVTRLHIPLVRMLRLCIKPDVIWRHVPNGEHRDVRTAAKLKAMGVVPGSADLEFFWSADDRLRVLFLELKLPGRKLSDAQVEFALRATMIGAQHFVATSIDEAIGFLGAHELIKRGVEICGKRW